MPGEKSRRLVLEAQRSALLRGSQLVYNFPACNTLQETKGSADRAVCGPAWLTVNSPACNFPSCLSCPARNGSPVVAPRWCLVLTDCAIHPAPCSVFPAERRDKFLFSGSVFWTRFVLIFRTQAPLHLTSYSPPHFLAS